ncbi:MAG TPA: peptide ligase PGM1-related protein [Candidatus Limnocylindrales bacterium]|nr:peptide ligase PGM1-related protein [Candidatus Limnocylindrales bacterium]
MTDGRFASLQERLGPALAANRQGSSTDHVMIALPSYSVSESLLSHYADRIPSLEHRYLLAMFVAARIPSCEVVYISSRRPEPEVIDYYTSLLPPRGPSDPPHRVRFVECDDGTPRSVAARLVDHPRLLDELRGMVAGRPALIEPWNVTEHEVALAIALDIPINGTDPALRPLGFKSAGRHLFREAGVPVPFGVEDVRTVDDVVRAIETIRGARPGVRGVVIKHDDSGAGDGNMVVDLSPLASAPDATSWLRSTVGTLPSWYLADLERGGIVEERIAGTHFTSPSAQVDVRPDGTVAVLATHEQVLGGESGQVYLGCRFPADPAYAAELARHAAAIGERYAAAGAIGRLAVDFVAASDDGHQWQVFALEVNLRKGGTTHPYALLRNLVPGRYDAEEARWIVAADGSSRCYSATDNLVDPRWTGLPPAAVIEAVRAAGLEFNRRTSTGVVLHMLSGLAIDGRLGLTAIAPTSAEAQQLEAATRDVIDSVVGSGVGAGRA